MNRVAIIEPVGGHGGMDYYDFGLCGGLAAAGVGVVLHTCDETALASCCPFDVRHSYRGIYGRTTALLRGVRFMAGSARAIFSAIRERRKVIHLHFFRVGTLALLNILLARLALRKVVITAHDVESFVASLEMPLMSRIAYRLAHRVVAHNQVSRAELIRRLHVPPEKIAVIAHGNYLHCLGKVEPKSDSRRWLDLPESAKVLLFFGQIKKVKGLETLLRAMPHVLSQHPEAILLIAGRPWKTGFSDYQALMDKLAIAHACRAHIRYIPDEDVARYYGAADLVVLPYLRIYQSGVVLMAMSYGKPVLVSDLPGMTEMITDGVDGFVFRHGDEQNLAQRVNQVLADPVLLESVASQGREMIEMRHDWAAVGRATAALYAELERAR